MMMDRDPLPDVLPLSSSESEPDCVAIGTPGTRDNDGVDGESVPDALPLSSDEEAPMPSPSDAIDARRGEEHEPRGDDRGMLLNPTGEEAGEVASLAVRANRGRCGRGRRGPGRWKPFALVPRPNRNDEHEEDHAMASLTSPEAIGVLTSPNVCDSVLWGHDIVTTATSQPTLSANAGDFDVASLRGFSILPPYCRAVAQFRGHQLATGTGHGMEEGSHRILSHYLQSSVAPVTSFRAISLLLDVDRRDVTPTLHRLASTLLGQMQARRAAFETQVSMELPRASLVEFVEVTAYDETPLPLRVNTDSSAGAVGSVRPNEGTDMAMQIEDQDRESQESQALVASTFGQSCRMLTSSTDVPMKVVQTRIRTGMLLRIQGHMFSIVLPQPCPLPSLIERPPKFSKRCTSASPTRQSLLVCSCGVHGLQPPVRVQPFPVQSMRLLRIVMARRVACCICCVTFTRRQSRA